MHRFRVVPLPAPAADTVRRTRRDDHGNTALSPLTTTEDSGLPCRVCLQDVEPGAEALIFSYAPVDRPRPWRFVGPVATHLRSCAPYADVGTLPPVLRRILLSVRAFDGDDELIEAEVTPGTELEPLVQRFFDDPRTRSLHLHTARRGCYLCRLERA